MKVGGILDTDRGIIDIDGAKMKEALKDGKIVKIGKIAGEQLTKLMTLGLTEKEAEEQIINGFLK